MRILVIGGTRFVGRAYVEDAVARGHEVTVFHRGNDPEGFPDAQHVHANRDGGLDALEHGTWDAVLDTCGYVPRSIAELAAAIGDRVGHYTFVSSLSVHPDDLAPGANEDSPIHGPPFPAGEEITGETYGPLKVACEVEARRAFGERCMIVRPGYIVGPNDPTDRFTWWLRRAAAGSEMLAPGPADARMQVVDARDLAAFMLDRAEAHDPGVYGIVGPDRVVTTGDVIEAARAAAGADTTVRWIPQADAEALGDEVFGWFPMWHPMVPGVHAYDAARALAAGLRLRPFEQTVADILAWDRARGLPPLRTGLPAEQEPELSARVGA